MDTVLITGVTGFIGQALIKRLHGDYNIRVLLHTKIKGSWDVDFLCDLNGGDIPIKSVMGVKTVFHLAGVAHDTRKDKDLMLQYQRINTDATIKLAKTAAANGVKNFVFISSVKAGGSPSNGECVDENYQSEPDGQYGKSKKNAEKKLLEIGKLTNMHVTVIRPALVYGDGVKGNLKLMLKGISKGWFPPLPYTLNIRTMIHVDDLVNAIILSSELNEANGEVFIVTDGKKYSSREIYDDICISLGKEVPRWYLPQLCFYIIALLGNVLGKVTKTPFNVYKYKKLFGDDCYCSTKISKKLGFNPNLTFKDALPSIVKYLD